VDFVSGNGFPVFILAVAEYVFQVIAQVAIHQRIIDAAEFSPEQPRFTQGNWRTDMPGNCQGIHQIQNRGWAISYFLVYCFSELADGCFGHALLLPASSTFC